MTQPPLTRLQEHVLDAIMQQLRRLQPDSAAKVLMAAARLHRQAMGAGKPGWR